ncbi:mitochondrial ribosomal protein S22 [Oratosquilla oratoria]|uniref:mitochondrial ribosomal protein S22 n=1 Tax=Oratosquilla oratoria TaxID=337810 RepID=UPI003F7668DE
MAGVRLEAAKKIGHLLQTNIFKKHCLPCSLSRKYCRDIANDPAPIFFKREVQDVLKRVTGLNLEKIFRRRFDEKPLKVPEYQFLTTTELDQRLAESKEKARELLQMPPVVKEREPISEVLSKDPALQGCLDAKYIFTDITFGVSDRKRLIVVRDQDGTLRKASWEERDRMNQIYNPRPGRKHSLPRIFLDEHLKDVLEREKYEFILDRACAHFEPDDPKYIEITHKVYDAVETRRHYENLHSTRHYGPLCFYLAWNKKIDNLLIDLIQKERIEDAADIVYLFHLIHPSCKSAALQIEKTNYIEYIKGFLEHDSFRNSHLQLALQSYEELLQERLKYEENVRKAHGI